jgi:UDPglucose 6-dehydrogenase
VDLDRELIRAVNQKKYFTAEPEVSTLVKSTSFTATDDYDYAIQNSDVTFVFVSTPTAEDGGFSTENVDMVGEKIARALKKRTGFPLVVLRSTVMPGGTDRLKDVLENASGKTCAHDFGLCYNPEFLALGRVARDLTCPKFILIGESDPMSGNILSGIYGRVCENNPPIIRTSFGNAELGKIFVNTYITLKMTFANLMAEVCETIPGADVDILSEILGSDPRIGRKYLSGGLAFGGTCFPRDNKALACLLRTFGLDARLPEFVDDMNRHENDRIVELVKRKLGGLSNRRIAILGISFKPGTDIIEESASLKICQALIREHASLSVFDPAAMENVRKVLAANVHYASSLQECLAGAELCILATPWQQFAALKPEDFLSNMKAPVLLDCWRLLNRADIRKEVEYHAVGLHS